MALLLSNVQFGDGVNDGEGWISLGTRQDKAANGKWRDWGCSLLQP